MHCKLIGWDDDSSNDAAKLAVEICGSDEHCSEKELNNVLVEVCREG